LNTRQFEHAYMKECVRESVKERSHAERQRILRSIRTCGCKGRVGCARKCEREMPRLEGENTDGNSHMRMQGGVCVRV